MLVIWEEKVLRLCSMLCSSPISANTSVKIDSSPVSYTHLDVYKRQDIKNVPGKYQETTGLAEEGAYAEASDNAFPVKAVQQSVELLKNSGIPYEFRTTAVKEFHKQQVLQEICIWIAGSPAYYLQQFEDSGPLIAKMEGSVDKGMIFHAYEEAEIKRIAEHLNHIPGMEGKVHLRGMNGE